MIPFDMHRLDGASDSSVAADKPAPITERIIEFGKVASLYVFILFTLKSAVL